ncbi:hypothetical protein Bresa_00508|uniref:Uncharacterized protein n=1 Tax=Brenneria salicis ATCC 15712 = DSM 30166 TaxID=714314 RepID=A0A366I2B3_9GAMM|nr:hypothetical protein [Brenneria salicis ATCC 15712 = DSM 30166]RBP60155.1 hypothetical protein DES54_13322 [Brenneria salicis ATCC 15712 = DSM 30166]
MTLNKAYFQFTMAGALNVSSVSLALVFFLRLRGYSLV